MKRIFLYTLIFCLLGTGVVGAVSLWDDTAANAYQSEVASDIGDLVTIIIVEKSAASQKASTQTSQDTSVEGGPGLGILNFVKSFSLDYDDKNSADGSTSRQMILDDKITAQIIDKQPNGNLIIRGTKMIKINGENQELEITGVIRQADIQSDNTIESTYMTDVEIKTNGEGVVGDKQKPGLLEKIFNWFF